MFSFPGRRRRTAQETGRAALDELRGRFDREEARTLAIALEASAAGSPEWDALLASRGILPGSLDDRVRLAQGGFAQRQGAPLAEVQQALRALEEEILQAWWELEVSETAEHERLRQHVMQRTREAGEAYAVRVKPRVELSDVFANALLSSQQHASRLEPRKHATVRCRTCGSPRASDGENRCRYCGHALYETADGASP